MSHTASQVSLRADTFSSVEEVQTEGDALLEGTEDEKKNADWDVSKTQENGTVACKTRKARKNLDNGLKWRTFLQASLVLDLIMC